MIFGTVGPFEIVLLGGGLWIARGAYLARRESERELANARRAKVNGIVREVGQTAIKVETLRTVKGCVVALVAAVVMFLPRGDLASFILALGWVASLALDIRVAATNVHGRREVTRIEHARSARVAEQLKREVSGYPDGGAA